MATRLRYGAPAARASRRSLFPRQPRSPGKWTRSALGFLPAMGYAPEHEGQMSTEQGNKAQSGLDAVEEILERFGVAGDADWMAVVLFARNLVTAMDLFSAEQKAQLQAKTFEQMARKPLDHKRFSRIVGTIQGFLLDNSKVADLRAQLKNERQGFNSLYDEMSRVFTDIKVSTEVRQTNIQRIGAD